MEEKELATALEGANSLVAQALATLPPTIKVIVHPLHSSIWIKVIVHPLTPTPFHAQDHPASSAASVPTAHTLSPPRAERAVNTDDCWLCPSCDEPNRLERAFNFTVNGVPCTEPPAQDAAKSARHAHDWFKAVSGTKAFSRVYIYIYIHSQHLCFLPIG